MTNSAEKADITSPTLKELKEQQRSNFDDPSGKLISSDRIEGTKVFRPDGEIIERISHFMVNKKSGEVEFAILSFGGFLGLGTELRPSREMH